MIETFTALALAHLVADYLLQPGWMLARKRHVGTLLVHGAVVLAVAMAAIGRVDAPQILALAAAHLAIDAVKTWAGRDGLAAHLLDQGAHLVTLIAVAAWAPDLWSGGLWAGAPWAAPLPGLMALGGGLLLATRAGGFAIQRLMAGPLAAGAPGDGLPGGGATIGLLERGLIFVLVLAGQPGGIGFLIAAKSILRFGAVSENRAASEYVIIGTLASFGWGLLAALGTQVLMAALPAIEIGAVQP